MCSAIPTTTRERFVTVDAFVQKPNGSGHAADGAKNAPRLMPRPLDRSKLMQTPIVRTSRAARYNSRMNWQERILINPAVRSGKPCVKGTRITVYDVLEYLAGGMSEDEILKDFPDLTREDIRACLAFAAARERRLVNSVA
jgi:uncharacterized protein (DUF433 family)